MKTEKDIVRTLLVILVSVFIASILFVDVLYFATSDRWGV